MIVTGDCVAVMAGMEPESVDAIVTDPPYGLEFMGKAWDRIYAGGNPALHAMGDRFGDSPHGRLPSFAGSKMPRCRNCGKYQHGNDAPGKGGIRCKCPVPDFDYRHGETGFQMQAWHERWATAALRVAKPGAYLLAFGGTRTYHRLACAIEDAGWIIRDTLVWAYAQGFPKSKALLKPAWEPIVMARKPGPLRELDIEGCRIGTTKDVPASVSRPRADTTQYRIKGDLEDRDGMDPSIGRWPANVVLTSPVFDGGWDGVVGGGMAPSAGMYREPDERPDVGARGGWGDDGSFLSGMEQRRSNAYANDTGTYSRFFLIPKASRGDREPLLPGTLPKTLDGGVWGGDEDDLTPGKKRTVARVNTHATVKPTELMRHLVRLVTPQGGTVLDPFLGSGTTALAAEQEGFAWIGIERDASYVAIAEARLAYAQRGLGLDVPAPVR